MNNGQFIGLIIFQFSVITFMISQLFTNANIKKRLRKLEEKDKR